MKLATLILSVLLGFLLVAVNAAETAPTSARAPLTEFVEPPPLDSKIVEMTKTNTVGSLETRIYFVEQWEIAPVEKAQVFFSMLEPAAPDDQRKLAHAAVEHVVSTNYVLVHRQLFNAKLPRPVLSVFMTDTLKRNNRVKMPILLALAKIDTHPMQGDAQQLLSRYPGRSHGTNWLKWEETMLAWLEQNPN